MAQNPPPPQYGTRSPDGAWWWDGQAWRPVPPEQQAVERAGQWNTAVAMGPPQGPPGKVRNIGVCILLAIVTLGIYAFVWVYRTQKEIKQHSDIGVGGGFGLLIFILISIVTMFLVPADVAEMHRRRGWQCRVSVVTGFWTFLPLIGHIVWFVKVQGTLNDYWAAVGGPPVAPL